VPAGTHFSVIATSDLMRALRSETHDRRDWRLARGIDDTLSKFMVTDGVEVGLGSHEVVFHDGASAAKVRGPLAHDL
jgi:hypothetical protein